MNNVSDALVIRGEVNQTVINSFAELNITPSKSVVLCDIEGAEFSVLTKELFSFLRGATFIIELHDKLIKNGTGLREELIEKIPRDANIEIIKQKQASSFEGITDLEELNDNDRALVMSEGRKFFGEWLVVEYLDG